MKKSSLATSRVNLYGNFDTRCISISFVNVSPDLSLKNMNDRYGICEILTDRRNRRQGWRDAKRRSLRSSGGENKTVLMWVGSRPWKIDSQHVPLSCYCLETFGLEFIYPSLNGNDSGYGRDRFTRKKQYRFSSTISTEKQYLYRGRKTSVPEVFDNTFSITCPLRSFIDVSGHVERSKSLFRAKSKFNYKPYDVWTDLGTTVKHPIVKFETRWKKKIVNKFALGKKKKKRVWNRRNELNLF